MPQARAYSGPNIKSTYISETEHQCQAFFDAIVQQRWAVDAPLDLHPLPASASCSHAGDEAERHLANGDDDDALAAGDAQAGHSQVVQILSGGLCPPDAPPHWLQKLGDASVLQHLCADGTMPRSQP